MNNEEYLLNYLKKKTGFVHPELNNEQQIRAMMNILLPNSLDDEFYDKQDQYLSSRLAKLKIRDVNDLEFINQIAIYQGDITLLKADAIVNAGNSALLGCFSPLHNCIDNAIHSYAGLEVRRDIMNILDGREVNNGEVIVTLGYNLPSKYIFHTVGPIYTGIHQNDIDLANCYLNCLAKADEMGLKNIVFCSLSTGVYGFPIDRASKIAFNTVKQYLQDSKSDIKVIFDLFSDRDYQIYERLFKEN